MEMKNRIIVTGGLGFIGRNIVKKLNDEGYDNSYYLEVESLFEKDESNLVVPWPNTVTDKVYPPKD